MVMRPIVVFSTELARFNLPYPEIPISTLAPVYDEVHAVVIRYLSLVPSSPSVLPTETPDWIATIPVVLEVDDANHYPLEQFL
jgi:hypothetical protein